MRLFQWMTAAALLGGVTATAEVPELSALVPETGDYQLIGKLNPLKWQAEGYQVDRSEQIGGELKRIGYLLKLTGKDGKESWVFTAMDAFSPNPSEVGVPVVGGKIFQQEVNNLEVAGNVEGLKTGKFEKGNIEFWGNNYGTGNAKKIPGASDKTHDFGDVVNPGGDFGSMQVHNYLEKQTVFAFNNLTKNINCDLGIGNNPKGHPDWTFSSTGKNYNNAELFIVGKFDNFSIKDVVLLNPAKVKVYASSGKLVGYAVNEEITFTIKADFGGQKPTVDYFASWTRTGDDGKKESGKEKITPDQPVVVKTSLDRPGFVRLQARLLNAAGKPLVAGTNKDLVFDGGAGVEVDKITGAAEPEDFDAFWAKQKAKLAAVPLKYTMDKLDANSTADVNVYAVSIDCAGPRPVTGYLTIPANAADKSLPAIGSYAGYGTGKQGPPKGGDKRFIRLTINAHGYELGKPDAYYKEFAESIKSNGKSYALDPKQNADPETAYFNGMVFRVLRSLEFLKSLPQWNGKDLTVSGGSQGGLQSIWAAGLDSDVTLCRPDVPWCCDLAGATQFKRMNGWRPDFVPALGYYDAVNHAKRIKCPVEITRAGLGDYTCPPSGVALLYNNIKTPKKIVWVQGSNHGYTPAKAERFVVEQK